MPSENFPVPTLPAAGAAAGMEKAISVRELVSLVLRSGDLGGGSDYSSARRALEGTRLHQRLQKDRPDGYEKEVPLSCTIPTPWGTLEIQGRIDGVHPDTAPVILEEIKSVTASWDGEPDPLHWAQARTYAAILAHQRGLPEVEIRLIYGRLHSDEVTTLSETHDAAWLAAYLADLTGRYIARIEEHLAWQGVRDQSLSALRFPFTNLRPGQMDLVHAVEDTIEGGGRLFAEAPTGIGKTLATLYPSVRALPGRESPVFYLTAKTSGKGLAEKAMRDLGTVGARVRSVILTAKDKICFTENPPCDLSTCPYAKGYYDRVDGALKELFSRELMNRAAIEEVARAHMVCPHELSLDAASWSDVVVGDYNHAFDPRASLKRFFGDGETDAVLLIDEAHNLPDRARDMFSASLERSTITNGSRVLAGTVPDGARALKKAGALLKTILENKEADGPIERVVEFPEELLKPLRVFVEETEIWLASTRDDPDRELVRDLYFEISGFLDTASRYGEEDKTIVHTAAGRLTLQNVNPARHLRERLNQVDAAVFFSATLRPVGFFKAMLGGDTLDPELRLASPFPPEHLEVRVDDTLAVDYKSRTRTLPDVAQEIAAFIAAHPGNHLVFAPSYAYLDALQQALTPQLVDCDVILQASGMTEEERTAFLHRFDAIDERPLIGLAVLGGAFAEGIDLTGERLIGVTVVGIGLPQLCLERDLIKDHFAARGKDGFDYAYTYPGINRIIQAAGRLIRTETDRGHVLLIDARYRRSEIRALLPVWWGL
jgi:DNA excision repair protein ERCC-2